MKDIEKEVWETKNKMIKEFEDTIGKKILDINEATGEEAMFSEFTLASSATATQGTSGYFGKLIKKIIKNIHANVKNIRVAIVHRTLDNRVIKMGIELEELSVNPPED